MKSLSGLVSNFQTLSQNFTNANGTLATLLINDAARYTYLKYFDNEFTIPMLTIGSGTLATTVAPTTNATSATLSTAWPNVSCWQLVVFGNSEQRQVNFVQNSTTATWIPPLTTANTSATLTCQGVQAYPLPSIVSKVKDVTITVGQLVFTPISVQSRAEWDQLNALPYNSAYPAYYYIWDNQIQFFPIPSTSNQVININCQQRVSDMNILDYTSGTISTMPIGSNQVTGSGTSWVSTGKFPTGIDIGFLNLYLTVPPPYGDGLPYQIQSFIDDTHLLLYKPVYAAYNVSGASYTIGQYPLLNENFHDVLTYWALREYFSSIVNDDGKFQKFTQIYNEKIQMMEQYLSNKSVNVDLSASVVQQNPNLYIYKSNAN